MTKTILINPKPSGAAEAPQVNYESERRQSACRQRFHWTVQRRPALSARSRTLSTVLAGALAALSAGGSLKAQAVKSLSYRGGLCYPRSPFYPLYYGNWGDTTTQQNYLQGLAAYMSG